MFTAPFPFPKHATNSNTPPLTHGYKKYTTIRRSVVILGARNPGREIRAPDMVLTNWRACTVTAAEAQRGEAQGWFVSAQMWRERPAARKVDADRDAKRKAKTSGGEKTARVNTYDVGVWERL